MLNIPLEIFTQVKKMRNRAKSENPSLYSFSVPYTYTDPDHPNNVVTVLGNPSLGEVKTMMIGVRNMVPQPKSGEVWVNELRLKEYNNNGGWAAQGTLNVQMSDFGVVNVSGKYQSEGFGGLEDGVSNRSTNDHGAYSVTTNLELGKFFPDKAKCRHRSIIQSRRRKRNRSIIPSTPTCFSRPPLKPQPTKQRKTR